MIPVPGGSGLLDEPRLEGGRALTDSLFHADSRTKTDSRSNLLTGDTHVTHVVTGAEIPMLYFHFVNRLVHEFDDLGLGVISLLQPKIRGKSSFM